jgi:hypothetical protein
VLTPYLALGALPIVWGGALSWAFAGTLTPIVVASCSAHNTCAAAWSGSGHSLGLAVLGVELFKGLALALGIGLPAVAFRTTGAIAEALAGSARTAAGGVSPVGRAAGMIALVAAASAGGLSGIAGVVLALPAPLSAASPTPAALLRPLSDELVRALSVGVSLSGPLLLGALFAAIFAGLWTRLAGARLAPLGPVLLPWLGIALVSLCVASWLTALPELARTFAQSTARLLGGM